MDPDFTYSLCFSQRKGHLYCDEVKVRDIQDSLPSLLGRPVSPFFLFSVSQLERNVRAYKDAFQRHSNFHRLGYAIKANYSPALLRRLRETGVDCAVAVSGYEVQLAIDAGFSPGDVILNGNGKQSWEIDAAVKAGCALNIDSEFDLRHVVLASTKHGLRVKVLLRLNPNIDPKVHPYIATGLSCCKFGIEEKQLPAVLNQLQDSMKHIQLIGLHCHLGSTIRETEIMSECLQYMLKKVKELHAMGFKDLRFLNLGGGLGIDQEKHAYRTRGAESNAEDEVAFPTAVHLIDALLTPQLKQSGLRLILEPGRSLVADAGILVTKVVGVKANGGQRFIVVDGAMTEVVRPALYQAYHHIELTEPTLEGSRYPQHVVGPVCESADFLGKDRWLKVPHEGCGVVVFDVGAYCGSMASNYNMRGRPAEVAVSGGRWWVTRRPDSYEDIVRPYKGDEELDETDTADFQ